MRPSALLLLIPVAALAGRLRSAAAAEEPTSEPVVSAPTEPSGDVVAAVRRDVTESVEVEGAFVPAGAVELLAPYRVFPASLTLEEVLPHGAPVNAGDPVARFKSRPWREEREAAERSVDQAERGLKSTRANAELEQRAQAAALAAAEEALVRERLALKGHVEVSVELRERTEKLTDQYLQHQVADQEDELAQLEAMYAQDELVDAIEEIVLSRSRRELASARVRLQLGRDQRAFEATYKHPNELRALERAVENAERTLEHKRVDQGLAAASRAARIVEAERVLVRARRDLEEARALEQALALTSPRQGILLHGGNRDWESGRVRPEHRSGDSLPTGRGAFLVAEPDRVRVVLSLAADQVTKARTASAVQVQPATGQAARTGQLSVEAYPAPDGSFLGSVTFDGPWVGALPGLKAKVTIHQTLLEDVLLVPSKAVRSDGAGSWCLVLRARPEGGEEYVRAELTLGATSGDEVVVLSGLNDGDRLLVGDPH